MRFVDTGFWVALLVPRDQHHAEATTIWHENSDLLLCSNHVVGETWTFLRRRASHSVAVNFLDALDRSPRVAVVHADPEVEDEARRWLRRHDERAYSFVDAVSFEIMRRRRLSEVLAFDGDFVAAGYVEVQRS